MPRPESKLKISAEQEARVADMLRVGGVHWRISEVTGVRPITVRRIAVQYGLLDIAPTQRRGTNRIPADLEAEVVKMLHAGVPQSEIVDTLGVSRSVCYRVGLDHGLQRSWVRGPEVFAEVERRVRLGIKGSEIAASMDVPIWYITQVRKEAGLPRRPIRPYKPMTTREVAQALRLLEDGASYGEVARTLGRTVNAIRKHHPGYAWTREQQQEWRRIARMRPEDHSTDEFKLLFAPRRKSA